jgi:hypothetical protein
MSSPGRTQPSMAEQSLDSLPILQHLSICEIIGPCYRNIFLPHAEITQNWCWCECWRKTYQDYFQFCNDVLCRLYSTFGPLVSRRLSGDINIIPIEWTTCLRALWIISFIRTFVLFSEIPLLLEENVAWRLRYSMFFISIRARTIGWWE